MAYLFDTDAISELWRKKPSKRYLEWVARVGRDEQFTSAVVIGEHEIARAHGDRTGEPAHFDRTIERRDREAAHEADRAHRARETVSLARPAPSPVSAMSFSISATSTGTNAERFS